jgi:hypothetical protein
LLETLGLSPLAEFQLQLPDPVQDATPELPDLMTEALLNGSNPRRGPQYRAAERQTRMAIADFLPNLFGWAM